MPGAAPALKPFAQHGARHVYEVAVVGSQLSGALAGALLAKRGYRVLWIEHDGLGPGYERDGYLLPYAPFVTGPLKSMPVLESALTELALSTDFSRACRPLTPALQLLLPDARLDLGADEAKRLKELSRELGDEAAAVDASWKLAISGHQASDAFFREGPPLPPTGFFERLKLSGQVRRHAGVSSPSGGDGAGKALPLLGGLRPFVQYCDSPGTTVGRLRALSQVLSGPARFPGGREALRELVLRKLVEHGGTVLGRDGGAPPIVEELVFDGRRITGLKLLRSDASYLAHCVVGATDAGALRRLVHDKKHHRKLLEQLDDTDTRRFLFCVNWVVPQARLPRGMGELLLVETADPELSPMLVQVSPALKVGARDEEAHERVVCAGAFVPATARDLGEEHFAALANRLHGLLDELMPFSRPHARSVSAPYLDARGIRGARLVPHPLYALSPDAPLGLSCLSPCTASSNLFLANREVLPGLGLEGEALAALRVAEVVQRGFKRARPA